MHGMFDEGHPRLKGFNTFYGRHIRQHMGEFEAKRRAARSRALGIAAAGAALAAGGAYAAWRFGWVGAVPIVAGIGLFIWAYTIVARAKKGLKEFLVEKVCEFFGLAYAAKDFSFPLARYDECGLVPDYNRSRVEDHISGEIDEVAVRVVDATLRMRTRGSKSSNTRTVFQGLLCVFAYWRPFNARTLVTDDRGGVLNWLRKMAVPGERVAFDDKRFERAFEVYSTDADEARTLLDDDFRGRALALVEQVGERRLRFGFDSGDLLVAVDTRRNMFEAGSIFGAADDPKRVTRLLGEITTIFDIVDTLELARR